MGKRPGNARLGHESTVMNTQYKSNKAARCGNCRYFDRLSKGSRKGDCRHKSAVMQFSSNVPGLGRVFIDVFGQEVSSRHCCEHYENGREWKR